MQTDINTYSSLMLKGLVYDEVAKIEIAQKKIIELNKLIQTKMNEENTNVPVEVTPEVTPIAPEEETPSTPEPEVIPEATEVTG